jgi:hypothetical protein
MSCARASVASKSHSSPRHRGVGAAARRSNHLHLWVRRQVLYKQDDLQLHRSRQQALTKVMEEDLTVLVEGRIGVTWFLGALEGTFAGTPFAAQLRYTRTWIHDDEHGWRVVAAHASPG